MLRKIYIMTIFQKDRDYLQGIIHIVTHEHFKYFDNKKMLQKKMIKNAKCIILQNINLF